MMRVIMSQVFVRPSTYRYEDLKSRFFEIMEALDGGSLIEPGRTVLIKPNLLSPAKPEQAVLTHPLIVRAAAEFVLQRGGRPRIGDSPAVGSFKRIIRESGIAGALSDLDVEFCDFTRSVKADVGEPFGMIDLAAEALEAPLIINLPKLKTHAQMGLTLGVKNLFGCVVGLRKPQWHLRTGIDRELFARLLVQIYRRINPALTLIDGILAMEGEGPGRRGIPREVGLLLGSRNAFAADHAVCRILGLNLEKLPILRVARQRGFYDGELEVDSGGAMPVISGFRLPSLTSLTYGPARLQGFIRRHLLQRPVCDAPRCAHCAKCWEMCPAGAISPMEEALRFDYDRCIRCYCCVEVCPQGALHTAESLTGWLVRHLVIKDA
jgi:uncharacterized protein (DUF362 family)/Pyruvate/2-oxoacid:ferredoxin oxidoreductase delta subunit